MYMNCPYWMDFLDERLWTPEDNILQDNIFIILSSFEISALARLCAIIYITICLPTLWLAGNCHILSVNNWYLRSIGIMAYEL